MDKLFQLIKEFWEWTEVPKEKWFITDISEISKNPVDFPRIGEICTMCIGQINTQLNTNGVDLFLMGMAIDSEDEDILEACKEKASTSFAQKLILRGVYYPQSECRWQIAELLKRNDIVRRDDYLAVLCNDLHPYVKKRACNVAHDIADL